MRNLIFAVAAATTFGATAPASAQTVYVGDGYRGGYTDWGYRGGYTDWGYRGGYDNWRGPGVEVRVGTPRARIYAYDDDAPRYRYRHRGTARNWDSGYGAYAYVAPRYPYRGYTRDWDDGYAAYAYSDGPYVQRSWGGPSVSVGFGYGGWDGGYGYRNRAWGW
jgi:hypothetical protein